MNNGPHKGTELNNVKETWDENEKRAGNSSDTTGNKELGDEKENTSQPEGIDDLVKAEAREYDEENSEDRLMTGERATINDEPGPGA
jgi:hypothetical protein